MKPFERNAANLNAALEFYGHATERARVKEEGGVKLIASGVPTAVFNIALLTGPLAAVPGELDRRMRLAGSFFREMGTSWSFWVCEDLLPPRLARQLHETFDRLGLMCIAESPGMEIDALGEPDRSLPDLEVRRVADADTRRAFCDLIAVSFQIPEVISERIYLPERAWTGRMEGFVGYLDGEPIASTALVEAAGAVGVYSVSTRPGRRRHGIAEALMRSALREFYPTASPIVLQSSRAGLHLYQKLGFKRVTRFFIYSTG